MIIRLAVQVVIKTVNIYFLFVHLYFEIVNWGQRVILRPLCDVNGNRVISIISG